MLLLFLFLITKNVKKTTIHKGHGKKKKKKTFSLIKIRVWYNKCIFQCDLKLDIAQDREPTCINRMQFPETQHNDVDTEILTCPYLQQTE